MSNDPLQTRGVPLVSCIMPTRDRPPFVAQAIWYFLRQDYPHKELIILDDGEDCVADLIPTDERVRYVRLDRQLTLGAKRNIGCEMSRGDLTAHWDDDAWIAPHWLSTQVRELLRSEADICGTRELLHYRLEAGEAWPETRETEARWSSAAAGLPVRHHKEFLPIEEVAQLLAAEADIPVYGYDDVPFASESSAVRVGLATGVPVLTSPTRWFVDLRDVTFQPQDLTDGARQLLEDADLPDRLTSAARDYCHENSWRRTAERHVALWQLLKAHN